MNNYRKKTLEAIAQNIIMDYDSELVTGEPCEIPIEEIIEFHFGIILQYRNLSKSGYIHGMTIFEDTYIPIYEEERKRYEPVIAKAGTMIIDKRLLAKNRIKRLRFTLGHELAHYIIHSDYYKETNEIASKISIDSNEKTEREADELGAALLMPYGRLKVAHKRFEKKLSRSATVNHLAILFNVSTKAMEIRLGKLGLM